MAERTQIKSRRARKPQPTSAERVKRAEFRVKDQLYSQMGDPTLTASERAAIGNAIEELGGDSAASSRVSARTPGPPPRKLEFEQAQRSPTHRPSVTRGGNIRVEGAATAFTQSLLESGVKGALARRAPADGVAANFTRSLLAGSIKGALAREPALVAAGTGEGDRDSFSGDPAFNVDEEKAQVLAALSAREASLAKLVTAAPTGTLDDIAGHVAKSTAAAQAGMDTIAGASGKLNGASPDERIQLLQELQRSPELQDLVKAGLMNWDDMLVKNPPAGSDKHVSNPDGDDPAYVIDSEKLADLRRKLAAYGTKQAAGLQNVQEAVARRRTTAGSVPSAQNAIFPGVKVWTPVAWAPAPKPGV